jgi:hypothetical protein
MSLRGNARLRRLEDQWRADHVASVLRDAYDCGQDARRDVLLDALTAADDRTFNAIAAHLTDTDVNMLLGPALCAYLDTLSPADIGALARGEAHVYRTVAHWMQDNLAECQC